MGWVDKQVLFLILISAGLAVFFSFNNKISIVKTGNIKDSSASDITARINKLETRIDVIEKILAKYINLDQK